jgi:uncharacterized protein YndB with AHSA1/START domain
MPYHWREFTKRIPIKAPAKSIYDAWSTQQGLESWFLRLSHFSTNGVLKPKNKKVEAGDRYKWLWFGYPDDVFEENEILMANGWDKLQFGFTAGCIVTVTIKQEDNETICELKQEMPMEDEAQQQYYFIECGAGWGFYLVNLKSVLEGGLDLRNKNVHLSKVITS